MVVDKCGCAVLHAAALGPGKAQAHPAHRSCWYCLRSPGRPLSCRCRKAQAPPLGQRPVAAQYLQTPPLLPSNSPSLGAATPTPPWTLVAPRLAESPAPWLAPASGKAVTRAAGGLLPLLPLGWPAQAEGWLPASGAAAAPGGMPVAGSTGASMLVHLMAGVGAAAACAVGGCGTNGTPSSLQCRTTCTGPAGTIMLWPPPLGHCDWPAQCLWQRARGSDPPTPRKVTHLYRLYSKGRRKVRAAARGWFLKGSGDLYHIPKPAHRAHEVVAAWMRSP